MNLLQKLGLYGFTIVGLSGLFYNKADSQIIQNDSKSKLENIVSNYDGDQFSKNSILPMYASLENNLQDQDVVYLKNGSIIRGQIVELLPDKTVKIKTADGSIYVYQMGDVEKIAKEEYHAETEIKKESREEMVKPSYPTKREPEEKRSTKHYKTEIALGYGNSFGGFGAYIQGDLSDFVALHAGGGYFPLSAIEEAAKDMFMVSGGLKVFFTGKKSNTRFFGDLQFGMLGGEYNKTTVSSGRSSYTIEEEQKALFGPSALLGGEAFFGGGKIGLVFAGGASYNMADVTWKDVTVLGALDVGLAVRF